MRPEGPLRVLFVVPTLAVGGAERHAATLLAGLDQDRFAGSLVCLQDGGLGTNWTELQAAGVPGVEFHRSRRDIPGMLVQLVRHLRRERPDVVILRGFNAETIGRVAGVLAGVPRLAVWVHNCGDVTPHGRLRRTVDGLLAKVTDAVYGVAHAQVGYITGELGHDRDKVRIVHNGTDLGFTTPEPSGRDTALAHELGIADDELVIGTAAVMRPEKDQATLLRAFRRVADARDDVKLVLAGDGRERPALEALVDELDLRKRVLFLGHRDDVPRLLRVFDVFTLSSKTVECFPMSVLEAMSAALPVVCTDVGGVPEMVADGVTGRVVPREDPEALAGAFLDVLSDPERARTLGRAGRARVREEFTLQRSIDRAQAVIEETAGRPVRETDALAAGR
ncbi:glycosyltransferase involved in cell wall biosynthesis [Actinomycetospora succinea]|uniref:Glycosyltransferase involved in cell wall biosynthesis n=1 Tax=Actinomycetospora succinea TaxID=663603 RepID=A0A4R6UT24_9PSEU|nr:glycosyltransferase involved in cell wall biosynthesis [Actinomycetospora succinea]